MIPRKPRRSSILKPPKQVVRAPLQDLDSDDDGTLTHGTLTHSNRRVSFSKTSQIKEFDPSMGYMTLWNQSYEESLESIEADENQAKSANIFDGLSGVTTQKNFKRKRTSTLQLSLSSTSGETGGGVCPDTNQSQPKNSGARAIKQPRKSLDCFKTEVVEEGDTSMFFDELNLTEPIKSTYSHIDTSSNLTRTLMDSVFDCSDAEIQERKFDVCVKLSSESLSKCIGSGDCNKSADVGSGSHPLKSPFNAVGGGDSAACNEPQNMSLESNSIDCTLAAGRIEVAKSFMDIESLGQQLCGSSMEKNSNIVVACDKNYLAAPLLTAKDEINDDSLFSLSSMLPSKDTQFRESKECVHANSSLEASKDLTIPQVPFEAILQMENSHGREIQVGKDLKENGLRMEDLGISGTCEQIVNQRNPMPQLERVNICDAVENVPKSLMDVLNTNGECSKEKMADNTVSSDMELSMTNGGIAIVEDLENRCGNSTQLSDFSGETHADVEGMEFTVALGKLKPSIGGDNSENMNPSKPYISNSVHNQPPALAAAKKFNEDIPKEKTDEDCVHEISYSNDLDETCGMEMTVSLGKIRERNAINMCENALECGNDKENTPPKELKKEMTLEDILSGRVKETNVECLLDRTEHLNGEAPINQETCSTQKTEPEPSLMQKNISVQQSNEENGGNHVDIMTPCSLRGNTTNPIGVGMDITVTVETVREKCSESIGNSVSYHPNVDDTNPDVSGMEFTVPLGKLKREACNVSTGVKSSSQLVDITSRESIGMEMTLPSRNSKRDNPENNIDNMATESHLMDSLNPDALDMELTVPLGRLRKEKVEDYPEPQVESQTIDDTHSEAMGMEFTVPLGRLKGEKHDSSVDDLLSKSQCMDETIPDAMGMELTVPLGKLRGVKVEDPVDNLPPQTQIVNDTNPEMSGMEFTGCLQIPSRENGNVPPQTQIVNDTNPEMSGMEFTGCLQIPSGENGNVPPQTQIVNDTNPEMSGMEFTGCLQIPSGENGNVPPQTQIVNDTNPEMSGMEFTGCLQIPSGENSNVPPQTQIVNDTNPEMSGMEFTGCLQIPTGENGSVPPQTQTVDDFNAEMGMEPTVPSGRLMGMKIKDHVDNLLPQNLNVDDTNPDMTCMELTVPLGKMKGGNHKEFLDNDLPVTQIVNGTNPDLMGMEFTVPLGKLRQENCKEAISNTLPPSHAVGDAKPENMGTELLVPSEQIIEIEDAQVVENTQDDSPAKLQVLNDKSLKTDSSLPGSLFGKQNESITSDVNAECQKANLTISNDMGMDLTVPLGRLKRVKAENCGGIDASETRVVDETRAEDEDLESFAALKGVKVIQDPSANGDKEELLVECESYGREENMGESKIELEAGKQSPVKDENKAHSSEGKEGDFITDIEPESTPTDGVKMNGVGVELGISLSTLGRNLEVGNPVSNEISACELEVESEHPMEGCDKETNMGLQNEAALTIEAEDVVPEQKKVEHSIPNTMGREPQTVCRTSMEFQAIGETFDGGELMEVSNTPTKRRASPPQMKNRICDSVVRESLDVRHDGDAYVAVKSVVNPVLTSEKGEHQFENRIVECERVDSEQLVSSSECPPSYLCSNKEADVSFDDQAHIDSEVAGADMDLTVPLGKLKSRKGVNTIVDAEPSPDNACVNVECGSAESNNDRKSNDNGPNAVNEEVMPSAISGFVPTCENKEQALCELSSTAEDRKVIPSKEVPMECVEFSKTDYHAVGDDCVEPMDDECDEENVVPNGIRTVLPSEPDCGAMEESFSSHMVHEMSYQEEVQEESSSIANDASDIPAQNMGMDAANSEERTNPVNSIEDWIKEESSKKSCDWSVYKLLENQFSFMVFHEAAVLIVNLMPLQEGQEPNDKRTVESVLLKSCISDESDWCIKVVLSYVLKRLSSSLLSSKCSSTEQLPDLFKFLNAEFLTINLLLMQTYDLMRVVPVDYRNDGFSFSVTSMKRMLLFEVQVNVLNWDKDGVKPEDVQVKNVIGKMGLNEIRSLVQSIKCDEHYLRNIYKEVLNFVFTLDKVLL